MKTISTLTRIGVGGIALVALASAGFSQTATKPDATVTPTPAAKTTKDAVVLDTFTVKEVPDDEQIMPTTRPISSVLGDDRNIIDTPRSVSSVNKDLMRQVRIKSVTDFSQFAPGVYTAARYGLATTPMVRGDLAELYFNGQRAKYSRDSVQPSFNGVEAIDIVKGPGSAIYGPQSNGAAGYTNFVTKQPYFDKQHTEVSLSYGAFNPDKNYSNTEWQIDNGGPISKDTAYRVSYLGREGSTYYQNTKDNTQDFFAALSHSFSSTAKLDVWVQYYKQTYSEVSGINRVTQDLIDHGTYIAGVATPSGFGVPSTIAAPTLVKIKPYQSVVGTDDIAHAERFQTQAIFKTEITPDTYLKNSSYFENRTSDKYEPAILYSEYVPTDWNIQNRTEYGAKFDTGSFANSTISGLDLKYERLISYQSFFDEQYSTQDLSKPSSTWSNVGGITNGAFNGAVPGHLQYGSDLGYNGNYGGNQDSKIVDIALFHQHDIKWTNKFSSLAGLRLDHLKADDQSPEFISRPGTVYHPAGFRYDNSASSNNFSYFLSSAFKPTPTSSFYATYNVAKATTGSSNFGGINSGGTDASLLKSLRGITHLTELGYKFVALDNKLYSAIALYKQDRVDVGFTGAIGKRLAKGIEAESVYQVNKDLSLIANLTYQQVDRVEPSLSVFQQNTTPYTLQPGGSYVAGGGGNTPVPYKRQYAGTPEWLGGLRASYKFTKSFSMSLGGQFTGSQLANAEGTLNIPFQYKINLVATYTYNKAWDFQVNVDNLTNERNWTVGDPVAEENNRRRLNPAVCGPRLSGLKVALVEDEVKEGDLLRNALIQEGARVCAFNSATDFSRWLNGGEGPDVLITDWVLADGAGDELIRQVRASDADVPVILMSGRLQENELADGLLTGRARFLNKPFMIEELIELVAEWNQS